MQTPLPPKTLVPARSLDVHFYTLYHRKQHCLKCGAVHEHSDILARYPIPSGYGGAPCKFSKDVEFNLKVQVVQMDDGTIPFCHECYEPNMLHHLPTKTISMTKIVPSWVGAGTVPEPAKPKAAPKPKAPKLDEVEYQWKTGGLTADDLDF